MNEKELLYQVLRREVDNVIGSINPSLRVVSNSISNYIINYIDPYIDAFMMGGKNINTEAAGAFVKKEVNEKVNNFMREFNKEKDKNL